MGVGWDAEPPYYIMEYLEQRLALRAACGRGPCRSARRSQLFRDVAVGLVHAHGKGVLHCDLKPANILLDQDGKPRLADFGQSRLSHEQAPALGTLFYMAPEQADMEAVPDARWDVYALGAVLYCMLTGSPPHRDLPDAAKLDESTDLTQRLARYRRLLRRARPARAHRQVSGVDAELAEIVDRCLAVDPEKRYPNVQAVLETLEARQARIARRPIMLFGILGPVTLLAVILGIVWFASLQLMSSTRTEFEQRAMASTDFAAEFGKRGFERALEQRFVTVEEWGKSKDLREAMAAFEDDVELNRLLSELNEAAPDSDDFKRLRQLFVDHQGRRPVQQALESLMQEPRLPKNSGSYVSDSQGVQIARCPEEPGRETTIGKDYSWRSYFHGDKQDLKEGERPEPGTHVERTQISAFFRSQATGRWMIVISTPVFDNRGPKRRFLGSVGLRIDANQFEELKRARQEVTGDEEIPQQFFAIVDWRDGPDKGRVVQHDLYDWLIKKKENDGKLPPKYLETAAQSEGGNGSRKYCLDQLPRTYNERLNYTDPLSVDQEGQQYAGRWLAVANRVELFGNDDKEQETGDSRTSSTAEQRDVQPIETDLVVLTQTNYETAIGKTMDELRDTLVRFGLLATASMVAVIVALWALAVRLMNHTGRTARFALGEPATSRPSTSVTPGSFSSRSSQHDPNAATEPLPRGTDDPTHQPNLKNRRTRIRRNAWPI